MPTSRGASRVRTTAGWLLGLLLGGCVHSPSAERAASEALPVTLFAYERCRHAYGSDRDREHFLSEDRSAVDWTLHTHFVGSPSERTIHLMYRIAHAHLAATGTLTPAMRRALAVDPYAGCPKWAEAPSFAPPVPAYPAEIHEAHCEHADLDARLRDSIARGVPDASLISTYIEEAPELTYLHRWYVVMAEAVAQQRVAGIPRALAEALAFSPFHGCPGQPDPAPYLFLPKEPPRTRFSGEAPRRGGDRLQLATGPGAQGARAPGDRSVGWR